MDKYMPSFNSENIPPIALNDSCVVCLEDFQIDNDLRMTLCRHVFHH